MAKVTHKIKEYIDKNGRRANVHWKMESGVLTFNHNGKWLSEELFEKTYPKYNYVKSSGKGENPNTKSFL